MKIATLLAVGLLAAWRGRRRRRGPDDDDVMDGYFGCFGCLGDLFVVSLIGTATTVIRRRH